MVRASKDNGRNEVGPHYGRCCCLLGHIRLWACSFGAASSADLLVGRIVFSFLGLHLAKCATREMIPCPEVKGLNPEKWHPVASRRQSVPDGTNLHAVLVGRMMRTQQRSAPAGDALTKLYSISD